MSLKTMQTMEEAMDLGMWLLAMLLLGLLAMGLCYLFIKACEKI